MAEGQPTPSLDFVFSEVSKQLDLQWQVWESVDGRLRLTLGFIGAIFVATLAFADPTHELSTSGKVFLVMAIAGLLISGLMATLAWLPSRFNRPPRPSSLRDDYLTAQSEETQLAVLDTMLDAYAENERRIDEKLAGFRNSGIVFVVAILLIADNGYDRVGAMTERRPNPPPPPRRPDPGLHNPIQKGGPRSVPLPDALKK